jgi:transposase-like protein
MRDPRYKKGDIVKESQGFLRGIEQIVVDITWNTTEKRYACHVCPSEITDPKEQRANGDWIFEENLTLASEPLPEEINQSFTNKITGKIIRANKIKDGSFRWYVFVLVPSFMELYCVV